MTGQTICGAYSAAVAALALIPQLRSQFQTRRLGGDQWRVHLTHRTGNETNALPHSAGAGSAQITA